MSEKGYAKARESAKVYARRASGLVRQITAFDLVSFSGLSFGGFCSSIVFALSFLFIYPGVDAMVPGVILCALLYLIPIFTTILLVSAMPRTAGRYVWISRTLHPGLGFMVSFVSYVWSFVAGASLTGYITNWALRDWFSSFGVWYNDPWLSEIGRILENPTHTLTIFATIIWYPIFGIALLFGGMRFWRRYCRATFIIALVTGLIAWIIVPLFYTRVDFTVAWNALASRYSPMQSYQDIVDVAVSGGYAYNPTPSLYALLGTAAWMTWAIGAASGQTAQYGGEIKRVTYSAIWGNILALVINTIPMIIAGLLFYRIVGFEFLNGIWLTYYGGQLAVPAPPDIQLFILVLTNNPIIAAFANISVLLIVVFFCGSYMMSMSRYLFAWSMDRIIPDWMSEVSPRWKVPMKPMLISVIAFTGVAIFLQYNWYLFAGLTVYLAGAFGGMCLGLAAIIFPFISKTKRIYEASPLKWSIGKVPLLSILGVLMILYSLYIGFFFAFDPALGATDIRIILLVVGLHIAGLVIFYTAKAIRRSQGIDISLAYKELPPE